ncbi:hypothetical protein [Anaerosporobacter faecicola]|uniref:hypothetical protein n=1 Tax=Anaerosporobacter faecicola TaxID=2718714 RepID=UPI001439E509|nr:hypothetical protein [Anaerosporobacter faecicola]
MSSFNPFEEKPLPIEKTFMNWDTIYPCPYNKETTDPYTKCRIVLMNGTEFEAQWFSRNFSRHCTDNDLRRELALVRRIEQQQQKRISCLKPKNESILEHTITYEQLAVDLTSVLAKQEPDCLVRNALNFALLEDFDHLYRYSNLLDYEYGICPKKLVGGYTEITPARPTISEHRYPKDSIFPYVNNDTASILTKLNIGIITAAEQQTMNYYMNVASLYDKSDLGRRLYQEIGMIEEQHVSQYESLKDTTATWLEELLMHEYTECYLYYSCMQTECDKQIRCLWEECFVQEIAHLHKAKDLLCKYEGKEWQQVIPCGDFPELLCLRPNIDYVRSVIETTTGNTQLGECIVPLCTLQADDPFYCYQDVVNEKVCRVASHAVIDRYINSKGCDYRFEVAPNPICELQNRRCDNTELARNPECTPESTQVCGTTKGECSCEIQTEEGPFCI